MSDLTPDIRRPTTPTSAVRRPQSEPKHDRDYILSRLEEAGSTLLSLPATRPGTALRTSKWPVLRTAFEGYGWSSARLRPAFPDAEKITRMDEALGWIEAIPQESYVLRRIVGARALVSPLNGRHLFSWRRLGTILGADPRAVRRWHSKGIALIEDWLDSRQKPSRPRGGAKPTLERALRAAN